MEDHRQEMAGRAYRINKAKRDGITDVQSTFLESPLEVREQIEDISEEWAQLKLCLDDEVYVGSVSEELRDPRVRLLYAVDADGRVLGVTSWLPTWRDGRVIGWTLDFMRHRTDSPNRHHGVPDCAYGRASA